MKILKKMKIFFFHIIFKNMDSINHRNLLLDISKPKSKIVRLHTNYNLSNQDKVLKNLSKKLQIYKYSQEGAKSTAESIIFLDGIINMNMDYLAAALYLYDKNDSLFKSKKGNTRNKITNALFSDDSAYIGIIKDILYETIKNDNSNKEEIWIRRKQNILIYLQIIATYLSEQNDRFNTSENKYNTMTNMKHTNEDEDDRLELIQHESIAENDD